MSVSQSSYSHIHTFARNTPISVILSENNPGRRLSRASPSLLRLLWVEICAWLLCTDDRISFLFFEELISEPKQLGGDSFLKIKKTSLPY